MLGLDLSFLFLIILLLFPIVALILALIVYFVMTHTKKEKEYTFRSLIWPFSFKKSIMENISDIFINPFVWVVELAMVSLIVLLIFFIDILTFPLIDALLIFFAGGVIALFFPIVYVIALWILDFKEREPLRVIVSLFLWGMCTAFISIIVSTILQIPFVIVIISPVILSLITAVVIAPVVEESVKSIGLFVIALNHEMDDVVDGILYGAIVGLGFAFMENWVYFSMYTVPPVMLVDWVALAALRSFLSAVGHAVFTGTMGGFLGFLKGRGFKYWHIGIIPGLIVAISLHAGFNFLLSTFDSLISMVVGLPLPLFAGALIGTMILILGVIFVFNVLHLKPKREKKKTKKKIKKITK